jgi:ribulose-phosphate 3-epimerase
MQNLARAKSAQPGNAGQRSVKAVFRHVSKPVARLVNDEVRGYAEKERRRSGGVDRREQRVVRRHQDGKGVPLSGDMLEILRAAGPKILAIKDAVVPEMAIADETQPRQPSMHGHFMAEIFEQVCVREPRKAPKTDISGSVGGRQAKDIGVQKEGRNPRGGGRCYRFGQRQMQSIRPHFVLIIRLCPTPGERKFFGRSRAFSAAGFRGKRIILAAPCDPGGNMPVSRSRCARSRLRFDKKWPCTRRALQVGSGRRAGCAKLKTYRVMVEIAPSILAADFSRLADEIQSVQKAGVSIIHVDVMDGHFVPNITLGPPVVSSLRRATNVTLDCHLMIEDADRYAPEFVAAGADMVSVHQEACPHLNRTLTEIRNGGASPGVVLNPATPLCTLDEVLDLVDYVLIMSVNPGFGGQEFIPSTLEKVRRLKHIRTERNLNFRIEIDGGISEKNAGDAARAGCDILVAGTAVFGKPDPGKAVAALLRAAEGALAIRA